MIALRSRVTTTERHGSTGLPGKHGGHGSGSFHNELKDVIDSSKSLEEFNLRVIELRDRWKIDPSLLPPLPKKT